MKKLLACYFAIALVNITAADVPEKRTFFCGIFQNKEKDVFLLTEGDGKGKLFNVPVVIESGNNTNEYVFTGPMGPNHKQISMTLRYEREKEEFIFLDKKEANNIGVLKLLTNQIPVNMRAQMRTQLRHFDGTQDSLYPQYALLATADSEHEEDLSKITTAVRQKFLDCSGNSRSGGIVVDSRDLELSKQIATNTIVQESLTVQTRRDKEGKYFEVWVRGKKIREQPIKQRF